MYSPGSAIWLSGTAPLHRGFPNFWGDGGGGGRGRQGRNFSWSAPEMKTEEREIM